MALSMLDKPANSRSETAWPAAIREEFDREAQSPNPCVGTVLVSETDKVRVWRIALQPGERIGFHRHVLNYFWSAQTAGRGRQHINGETVDYSYMAGETRHETYDPGECKIHDLENIGDTELVFMTVEFLDSANKPLPIPQAVRLQAAA